MKNFTKFFILVCFLLSSINIFSRDIVISNKTARNGAIGTVVAAGAVAGFGAYKFFNRNSVSDQYLNIDIKDLENFSEEEVDILCDEICSNKNLSKKKILKTLLKSSAVVAAISAVVGSGAYCFLNGFTLDGRWDKIQSDMIKVRDMGIVWQETNTFIADTYPDVKRMKYLKSAVSILNRISKNIGIFKKNNSFEDREGHENLEQEKNVHLVNVLNRIYEINSCPEYIEERRLHNQEIQNSKERWHNFAMLCYTLLSLKNIFNK